MKILYFSNSDCIHDRRFVARFMEAGFETCRLRLDACAALDRHIADSEPDILFAGPVPNCGYLAALTGFSPLVVMSWGSDLLLDQPANDSHRVKIRTALDRSNLFVCDCHAVLRKAEAIVEHAIPSSIMLPWGTDLSFFQPAFPKSAPPAKPDWKSQCVVFSNRSWTGLHGVRTALESFYLAWECNSALRLVLAADGLEQDFVYSFITAHGMAGAVYTPGFLDAEELPAWYQAADAYLSCSAVDGSSVSLLEALACGLPVVVSDIEGNREWVEQGKNGWLAPACSPESFAKRLLEIAALPA